MPKYLTIASQIQCPHAGQLILTTANAKVSADGGFVLLESDQHVVAGCPFTIGPKYSPCVRVQWSAGSAMTSASAKPLTDSSIGICYSPEGAPQGVAVVVQTQQKVDAL
jgi:hypothetical protein